MSGNSIVESKKNYWMNNKKGKFKNKSNVYCSNCGKHDHRYKSCQKPTTSFGVINILITTDDDSVIKNIVTDLSINVDKEGIGSKGTISISTDGIKYNGPSDIKTFCTYKDNIRFLMIRRKHTLGFLEFIRGRYNVENVDGIISLFSQMTKEEIYQIGESTLEELWTESWSSDKNKTSFQYEFEDSKLKFDKLSKGVEDDEESLNLEFYVKNVNPKWKNAEWGFPKGRRNYYETDIMCGIREFQEESGVDDGEYVILDKINPILEDLIGTDGKNYRHIYFPSISTTNKLPEIVQSNKVQSSEIGDIGWFTYEEALGMIRPNHTERKKLLTELYMYIINSIAQQ
jgi:8-oxo-dGTP pyrophosphatase MutT (NUDIX family)